MSLLSRILPRRPKTIGISVFLLLFLGVGAWQGLRAWWLRGFSEGTRTGTIRKISYKGSPLCKYWSGEMAVAGSSQTNPEIWEFTVDGPDHNNPIVQQIEKASAAAKPVTLKYRQDKGRWWACAPTEYYVTGVLSL